MANRIKDQIAVVNLMLEGKDKATLDGLSQKLSGDITFEELCHWQELKSAAQAAGVITLEEALTVYDILGKETPLPEKFSKRTIAEKMAVFMLVQKLSGARAAGLRRT